MKKIYLHDNWTLSGKNYENLPAIVPGCVHTDLQRANIIPDCFWRDNNLACQWIENESWTYSCSFPFVGDDENATLIFEGLDTYADIYLNGERIGESHNMFIPHSFPVSGKLKSQNDLSVVFRSPVKEVENMPKYNGAFTTERMNTRRTQCSYTWDWLDRFVTCGIILPVYLQVGEEFCVDNTYIYTEQIDDFGAGLNLTVNFKNYQFGDKVAIEIIDPNGKTVHKRELFVHEPRISYKLNISSPKLWYPLGYGDQPLYLLRVTCKNTVHEEKFGIRTIRVAEISDSENEEFLLKSRTAQKNQEISLGKQNDFTEDTAGFIVIVNGVRIYCRGANWVPCSPFHSEESDDKIKRILALSVDAGVNMIRVWGGGWFEKDILYDECDRLGILVTQDFLMACGDYPQKEQWFLNELNLEAEFACKKLRNHACLAWWSGDNENAMHGADYMQDYNGRDTALIGLEPIVYALDPNRRFHRSSPYGGTPYMSITRGTTHTTNFFCEMFDYFLYEDCVDYKERLAYFLARFIVEEPVFGLPQRCSLLKFMTNDDLYDEEEKILRFHSKNNPGIETALQDFVRAFAQKALGKFKDTDDKLFKMQFIQNEWIRVVGENCRRNIRYNDGLLFWMLNDCWPASMGWSLIDYYNLPKASYYAFKRFAKPLLGSIVKENNKYVLYVSSDGSISGNVKVTAQVIDSDSYLTTTVKINGYEAQKLVLPFAVNDGDIVVCDVSLKGKVDRCFYRDGTLPLVKCDGVSVVKTTDRTITLRANRYCQVVYLEGEFLFNDNCFTMLDGEEITISYTAVGKQKEFTISSYEIEK